MIQNYESFATWGGIVYFIILSVLLLLGNIIRRKIPLFKKSLLPTAVIAGLLGLLIKELVFRPLSANGTLAVDSVDKFNAFLNLITYHTLALASIAMGLKVNENGTLQG